MIYSHPNPNLPQNHHNTLLNNRLCKHKCPIPVESTHPETSSSLQINPHPGATIFNRRQLRHESLGKEEEM